MKAIIKRRMTFNQWSITKHPKLNENVATLLNKHEVFPSLKPQILPDWCIDTDEMTIGISDGYIIAIGELPQRKSQPTVEPMQDTPEPVQQAAQSPQENQAELEEMLNTPISNLVSTATVQWPTRPDGFPRRNQVD
jgi:hypothetical protein